MSRDVKIALLKALIKTKDSPRPTCGICQNVDRNIQTHWIGYGDYLASLFMSWPKFSGVSAYPVPHPAPYPVPYPVPYPDYESAVQAYNATTMMWEGAYGDLRRELLDHCINELEKELGSDAECPQDKN